MSAAVARSGAVVVFAFAVWAVLTAAPRQSAYDPAALPLVTRTDIRHVGAFRVPADLNTAGYALAYNPAHNSLFISQHDLKVAEVAIPAPVESADLAKLPTAGLLQAPADPFEGQVSRIGGSIYSGWGVGGLFVLGDRLIGNAYVYYDAGNDQRMSLFSRSTSLSTPSFHGFWSIWDPKHTGFVSGWLSEVPAEWRTRLGGSMLTGQCCIPIVSRTSLGPSAFAFDPVDPARSTSEPIAASPLVYYTGDHATLGPFEGSRLTYGGTTAIGGMSAVAGTRTLLYVGTNGTGTFCYGDPTDDPKLAGTKNPADQQPYCYCPICGGKGQSAYPYQYQFWAYDLNDLAAVKAGRKKPWEPVPYDVWPFTLPIGSANSTGEGLAGVSYDASRQLLYVAQLNADSDGLKYWRPLIHVFKIR
jgi:hypothetical protein